MCAPDISRPFEAMFKGTQTRLYVNPLSHRDIVGSPFESVSMMGAQVCSVNA